MTGVVVGRCPCGGYGVVHDDKAQRETGVCHAPLLSASEVMQDDMRELLEALGRPSRIARDLSPHEVMQREIIPTVRDRSTRARFLVADIEHCLASPADVTPRAAALLRRARDEIAPRTAPYTDSAHQERRTPDPKRTDG